VKPVDFTLHQPATVDEALQLLSAHADDARVLAGGQSLIPLLNFRLARPDHVIDIGRVEALGELRGTQARIEVGAMVRQSSAERSPVVAARCPLLAAALPNIAHPPIRARGTIGGSLAHADPAAELPAVAVALDATFVALSVRGRREMPAAEFFQAYLTTALSADELLAEIYFPAAAPRTGAAFREVSRRRGDFAMAGAAAQVTLEGDAIADARICISGVAGVPFRCTASEQALRGRRATAASLRLAEAAVLDTLDPAGDLHATAGYRKHAAGVLLRRAVAAAYDNAAGTPAGELRESGGAAGERDAGHAVAEPRDAGRGDRV
jgi:aerobic carbon-monoxide dehydrogenase medium subunit